MEQSKTIIETNTKCISSLGFKTLISSLHNRLGGFQVLITEIISPESLEGNSSFSEIVVIEMLIDCLDSLVQLGQNPLVDKGELGEFESVIVVVEIIGNIEGTELDGLPEFISKLSVSDDSLNIQVNEESLEKIGQKTKSERITSALSKSLRIVLLHSLSCLCNLLWVQVTLLNLPQ